VVFLYDFLAPNNLLDLDKSSEEIVELLKGKEDDFIYDEAYSKSIRARVDKMMKELVIKKKEAGAAKIMEEERLAREAAAKKIKK